MHLLHNAPLPVESISALREIVPTIEISEFTGHPSRDLLQTTDVIFTEDSDFDVVDTPRLLWVQTNTASVAGLRGKSVMSSQIPVCTAGGSLSTAVAECAIGALLSLTRQLKRAGEWQRDRRWPTDYTPFAGTELYGLTMGIVGYGSVGRQIARVAQALGMTVLACKRNSDKRSDDSFLLPGTGDPDGTIPSEFYGVDRLHEMLSQSHVAVVTLPGTPHTNGLIGADELKSLPRNAFLVNVGRGSVTDESALIDSLTSGHLAGAALDVFAEEPLPPTSLLWGMDNVLITPHIGSFTTSYARHAAEVLIENVRRHTNGKPLVNVIDKDLLY